MSYRTRIKLYANVTSIHCFLKCLISMYSCRCPRRMISSPLMLSLDMHSEKPIRSQFDPFAVTSYMRINNIRRLEYTFSYSLTTNL